MRYRGNNISPNEPTNGTMDQCKNNVSVDIVGW